MRVPEYPDPIRVRWYWTPDPEAETSALDGYSSSDWDPFPHLAPTLGEDGVQRSPFRDWADGSPPPWPQTVPVGTGVGLALADARRVRVASGSGVGVSAGLCVAGYTRVGFAAGYGAGMADAARVGSRIMDGAGLGSGLALSTSGHARAVLASGAGVGSCSTTADRGRKAASTGTGAATAAATSLSGRAVAISGTGASSGTSVERNYRLLTPDQVANLYGWWKADAGVYKDLGTTLCADTDTVEQWNDQSGASRHLLQTTGAKRPQYRTSQLNGLPVVRFAGAHCLTVASVAITTFTVLIVAKASGAAGVVYEHGADVNSNDGMLLYGTNGTTLLVRKSAVVSSRNDSGSWLIQSLYVPLIHQYPGFHAQHQLFFDDVTRLNVSSTANEPGSGSVTATLNVGARNNAASLQLTGDICELVLYTPAITMLDARGVLEYLRQKWNL